MSTPTSLPPIAPARVHSLLCEACEFRAAAIEQLNGDAFFKWAAAFDRLLDLWSARCTPSK